MAYWERISAHILQGERADYGKKVIQNLANNLTAQFGEGWSKRNLLQMIKFYQTFPQKQIVQALSAQLSWTHFM